MLVLLKGRNEYFDVHKENLYSNCLILKYISKDGVWVGHLLSGYSLPMDTPPQVNGKTSGEVTGMWKHSIKVSYEATKAAFPGGEVIAHLDHK